MIYLLRTSVDLDNELTQTLSPNIYVADIQFLAG